MDSFQIAGTVINSLLSKFVDANELTRAFSLQSVVYQIIRLVYSPLFNYTYQETVEFCPEATFYLSLLFSIILVFLFMWVISSSQTILMDESFAMETFISFFFLFFCSILYFVVKQPMECDGENEMDKSEKLEMNNSECA